MKIIDLFCGFGGFSQGAKAAGCDVVWAGDFWDRAIETHLLNHPDAAHVHADLLDYDWGKIPKYDIMIGSPECKFYSTASQPKRSGCKLNSQLCPWAVVDCAEETGPLAFIVENVPQIVQWGRYGKWKGMLEKLGYHVQEHVLSAHHFGVPQKRARVFIVGTKRSVHLSFNKLPTHGFGPLIDWDIGSWRDIRAARPRAQERILAAQKRWGERFLIQHVTGHKGLPLSEPIRTITTQDQWAVVRGDKYRSLTARETARGMGFDDDYLWDRKMSKREAVTGFGNAVCPPVAEMLIRKVIERV